MGILPKISGNSPKDKLEEPSPKIPKDILGNIKSRKEFIRESLIGALNRLTALETEEKYLQRQEILGKKWAVQSLVINTAAKNDIIARIEFLTDYYNNQ